MPKVTITTLPKLPVEQNVKEVPFGYYMMLCGLERLPVVVCYAGHGSRQAVSLENPQRTWDAITTIFSPITTKIEITQ